MKQLRPSLSTTITRAIMRHAGLSDFDRESVEAQTKAIINAIVRSGFTIERKDPPL